MLVRLLAAVLGLYLGIHALTWGSQLFGSQPPVLAWGSFGAFPVPLPMYAGTGDNAPWLAGFMILLAVCTLFFAISQMRIFFESHTVRISLKRINWISAILIPSAFCWGAVSPQKYEGLEWFGAFPGAWVVWFLFAPAAFLAMCLLKEILQAFDEYERKRVQSKAISLETLRDEILGVGRQVAIVQRSVDSVEESSGKISGMSQSISDLRRMVERNHLANTGKFDGLFKQLRPKAGAELAATADIAAPAPSTEEPMP